MDSTPVKLGELDLKILEKLQENCKIPLEQLASELNIPKSTLHYRITKAEKRGIIKGCHARLDASKLGKNYVTITLVRAKYGPGYHKRVGEKLASLPGVWAVYFVLGETDFVVLARTSGPEEFARVLEKIMNDEDVERTVTMAVLEVVKEDFKLSLK